MAEFFVIQLNDSLNQLFRCKCHNFWLPISGSTAGIFNSVGSVWFLAPLRSPDSVLFTMAANYF